MRIEGDYDMIIIRVVSEHESRIGSVHPKKVHYIYNKVLHTDKFWADRTEVL